jgi:hypothetical protein
MIVSRSAWRHIVLLTFRVCADTSVLNHWHRTFFFFQLTPVSFSFTTKTRKKIRFEHWNAVAKSKFTPTVPINAGRALSSKGECSSSFHHQTNQETVGPIGKDAEIGLFIYATLRVLNVEHPWVAFDMQICSLSTIEPKFSLTMYEKQMEGSNRSFDLVWCSNRSSPS